MSQLQPPQDKPHQELSFEEDKLYNQMLLELHNACNRRDFPAETNSVIWRSWFFFWGPSKIILFSLYGDNNRLSFPALMTEASWAVSVQPLPSPPLPFSTVFHTSM
jgi:hypothetical protein